MKVNHLLEAHDRKIFLQMQQELIDHLDDEYDVRIIGKDELDRYILGTQRLSNTAITVKHPSFERMIEHERVFIFMLNITVRLVYSWSGSQQYKSHMFTLNSEAPSMIVDAVNDITARCVIWRAAHE